MSDITLLSIRNTPVSIQTAIQAIKSLANKVSDLTFGESVSTETRIISQTDANTSLAA